MTVENVIVAKDSGALDDCKISILTVEKGVTTAELIRMSARDAPRWANGQAMIAEDGIAVIGNTWFMLGEDNTHKLVAAYWTRTNQEEDPF